MTHLDEPERPSCPLCTTREDVRRDRVAGRHVYLCGLCWTVFTGGEDEWHHFAKQRDIYQKHYAEPAS